MRPLQEGWEDPVDVPGPTVARERRRDPMEPVRVAVADDDEGVRRALGALLRSRDGVELVGEAGDAEGIVALVTEHRPDVVVLDVRMPGGGAVAAQRIRELAPSTRLIALSAHDTRVHRRQMAAAGVDAYLVKGEVSSQLWAVLTEVMGR